MSDIRKISAPPPTYAEAMSYPTTPQSPVQGIMI